VPDRETAALINSGAIHVLRGLRRVDRLAGVTPARLSALSVLVFGGPCTMGELAAAEDVAGPTMTRIVDGLEQAALVRRTVRPNTGRRVEVSATRAGDRLMRRAAGRRVEALVTAMNELDEADRRALTAAGPALVRLGQVLREL
jgi:DNA-binding MarR family transcriptional regulator